MSYDDWKLATPPEYDDKDRDDKDRDGGIPMNPICPRCGGKHGIEVSGDGYEWDCGACGGHLMCAIGEEGEMYPYHREDGTCGCESEPHTCDLDEAERAECLADAAAGDALDRTQDGCS